MSSSLLPGPGLPIYDQYSRWKKVGRAKYFGFDFPECPFDKSVVRAFQRDIDPLFMPLVVENVYRSHAGGTMVFRRHVIATGSHYPVNKPHLDFKYRPVEFSFAREKHYQDPRYHPAPHDILEILEGPPIPWAPELPGAFIPISWLHYHKYKALLWMAQDLAQQDLDHKDEEAKALVESKKQEVIAAERYFQQESNYRWDHDWRYFQKQHAGLTVEELRLIHASRLGQSHDGRMIR